MQRIVCSMLCVPLPENKLKGEKLLLKVYFFFYRYYFELKIRVEGNMIRFIE